MQPKEFFGWLCKSQQDATFCLFLIRNLFFLWDKNLSHSQSLIKNTYFLECKPLLSAPQTFTFVLPNRCFCGSKPPFLHFILSFSCNIFLCFPRSVVLSCCVHPLVAVLKTVSLAYNNIMCASTMWCLNCKQLLKRV